MPMVIAALFLSEHKHACVSVCYIVLLISYLARIETDNNHFFTIVFLSLTHACGAT